MAEEKKKTITKDTVEHVARLSRLSLTEKEVAVFQKQLSNILGYIEQLEEVDIEGISPTTHVLSSMKNVFRQDEVRPSISNGEALLNAPDKKDGFFKVPKVIKDE